MDLTETIQNLEAMELTRSVVDCKRYDEMTISYSDDNSFGVLINNTDEYSNIRQIILYAEEETINLILQTIGLTTTKIDIANITTIIKTEQWQKKQLQMNIKDVFIDVPATKTKANVVILSETDAS